MARIRTIKPEFWKHEDLSALPEATHMLAAALLNYADDEGYFNANPKLITAELSPLREPSVSIQDSLKSLYEIGYLRLGHGEDGRRYGHIIEFTEHQRINRPTDSKIKQITIVWDEALTPHTHFTEQSPPERNREQGKEQGREGNREGGADAPDEVADAADLWNALARRHSLPTIQLLTDERRSKLRKRLSEAGGLDGWRHALGKVAAAKWMHGENDRGWKADIDFVLQRKSFTRLMEGGYDRAPPKGQDNGIFTLIDEGRV
ncbi:MAG: hypothetical protein KG075_17475 [Alphaproteobacteria bacterium]|nr:hypothetical protein [Alphaproteobacteria bacterium]